MRLPLAREWRQLALSVGLGQLALVAERIQFALAVDEMRLLLLWSQGGLFFFFTSIEGGYASDDLFELRSGVACKFLNFVIRYHVEYLTVRYSP